MLASIKYPLTIFHKPHKRSYQWSGGPEGVERAHRLGATAIDIDAQWSATAKRWIAVHWAVPTDHGFSTTNAAYRGASVRRLSLDAIATFRSVAADSRGYRIHTLREVMAEAKRLGMTVCVEVKSDGDFESLRHDAEVTGCRVLVMALPHIGGTHHGYKLLAKAKDAGLPTMVLLNGTKYGRGRVPAWAWADLDYVKGGSPLWRRGKPARVKRLGPGSLYGASVGVGNARRTTARIRARRLRHR